MNADGTRLRRITSGDDWYPAWSPDGQWIAFWRHAELPESIHPLSPPEPIDDLFLVRPDGSALTRITSGRARDMMPNWSPDGTQIVFVTDRSGGGIATMSPSGDDIRILSDGGRDPFWSPDGARIGFVRYSNTSARIYSIRADGSDLQVIVGHAKRRRSAHRLLSSSELAAGDQ